MNNCPLDIYSQDYSHSKWFVMLDIFKSHPERIITAIPLTIHLITENILQQTGRHQYLPVHIPPEHWVREGRIIKNKKTYRYYLKAIIDTALNHGIRVILPGFAFYLPDNYNKYSFENKLLDYNEHLCPVSIWGTPENVVNGIMSNNSITMSLAMEYNIPFISMNLCIPHNKEYYNDICHLTPKGISIMSQKLAEHIVSMEQTKNNLTPE
ncbi:MAG: hypothetical protein SVK54_08970 [candidate division WOR-3 bacterium]|nr:hypothetical protein [candidate division WOR-3 bacterium]